MDFILGHVFPPPPRSGRFCRNGGFGASLMNPSSNWTSTSSLSTWIHGWAKRIAASRWTASHPHFCTRTPMPLDLVLANAARLGSELRLFWIKAFVDVGFHLKFTATRDSFTQGSLPQCLVSPIPLCFRWDLGKATVSWGSLHHRSRWFGSMAPWLRTTRWPLVQKRSSRHWTRWTNTSESCSGNSMMDFLPSTIRPFTSSFGPMGHALRSYATGLPLAEDHLLTTQMAHGLDLVIPFFGPHFRASLGSVDSQRQDRSEHSLPSKQMLFCAPLSLLYHGLGPSRAHHNYFVSSLRTSTGHFFMGSS